MRQAAKRTDKLLPIATLGDHPLVPDGCFLTVKVYGAHSVVSLIHPTSACPVQAQEVFTNLESRLLLVLLAFPEGCTRAVLLTVVRLSPQEVARVVCRPAGRPSGDACVSWRELPLGARV